MKPTRSLSALKYACLASMLSVGATSIAAGADANPPVAAKGAQAFAAPTSPLSSGAWRITQTIRGGPRNAEPQSRVACFNEKQLLSEPAAPLLPVPPPRGNTQPAAACDVRNLKMAEGKVSFEARCPGPMGEMKADWHGTYDAVRFRTDGKIKMGFMSAQANMVGEYIGKCEGN